MDAWLKARAEDFAQAAQQVSELSEKLDPTVKAKDGSRELLKELKFGQGALGFRLENLTVAEVDKGTQAARLGLEVGDHLLTVDRRPVPEVDPADGDAVREADELVRKWMSEMPLPAMLVFAPGGDAGASEAAATTAAGNELADAIPAAAGAVDPGPALTDATAIGGEAGSQLPLSGAPAVPLAAAAADAPDVEASEAPLAADGPAELARERAAKARLAAELEECRRLQSQAAAGWEAERRQSLARQRQMTELQKELATLKAARADEVKATTLQLTREVEELGAKLADAEERAAACEAELGPLRQQLDGFGCAHDVELELMRSEHERILGAHRDESAKHRAMLKEQSARELEDVRRELADARRREAAATERAESAAASAEAFAAEVSVLRVEAEAAKQASSAAAAAALAASPSASAAEAVDDEQLAMSRSVASSSPGVSKEVTALYDRIGVLEQRCVTLQKKLNARPILSAPAGGLLDDGSLLRPAWERRLADVAGPVASALAAELYQHLDRATRRFTQRLLARDLWRWVFYAHVVLLYAVAASCYAQASMDAGAPVDAINVHMHMAKATASPVADVSTAAAAAAAGLSGT